VRQDGKKVAQRFSAAIPGLKACATTASVCVGLSVALDEKNDARAWGAQASLRMNLEEADLAPERELNEIIWRSIRGADSAMPPTVRSAFIRRIADGDDDDDDRPARR
jgi:hypothetical protein